MAAGQPLRGLVAQGMDGRKASPTAYAYTFPPGTYTWVAPVGAVWKFVLWGGGGGGNNGGPWGGGSGALYIAERFIPGGASATITTGLGGAAGGGDGGSSTVTLPGGEVLTAGGALATVSEAGGSVTANRNTDVVYAGSAGGNGVGVAGGNGLGGAGGTGGAGSGLGGGGAGSPGFGTFRGANGATSTLPVRAPSAGGAVDGATGSRGGDGLILIQRVT
jgi:hypothetical protein